MIASTRWACWLVSIAACGGSQGPAFTERTIEGDTQVEVEEIPVGGPTDALARPAANVDAADPGTFPRDQPAVHWMKRWNGAFVVAADELYGLDATAGEAHRLVLAGADRVLDVAMRGPVAIALVRRGTDRTLFQAQDDRWVERALPEAIRTGDAPLTLGADASSVVLLASDRLWRLRGTTWTNVAVGPLPLEMRGTPQHALLAGDLLYLGWDSGEWGGGLFVLDTRTGQWSVGPDEGVPAHDIVRGPDGVVWAATGLADLGSRRGAIHRHDGARWTTVAATGNPVPTENHDWTLPPDSMQAIAFSGDSSLSVLTGTLGVVSRDAGGQFHQRTHRWPASRYLYVQALELDGDRAVIASYDAGVWLWNLRDGVIRRVPLRAPAR